MAYAEKTSVSAEKSRAEIESTLKRYGADSFGYMTDSKKSTVAFKCKGRAIRITIQQADGSTLKRTSGHPYGYPTPKQRQEWIEQEGRRRWRALLLVLKAKLEAVQSGIATFEDEFMPYTILPGGQTMAEWMRPQWGAIEATGSMPLMLGDGN